jgi:hypothetical protein
VDRVLTFRIVSTETYHAMYRVLEAFSLFNTILGKLCQMLAVWITDEHCIFSLGLSLLLIGPRAQTTLYGTPIDVVLRYHILSLV